MAGGSLAFAACAVVVVAVLSTGPANGGVSRDHVSHARLERSSTVGREHPPLLLFATRGQGLRTYNLNTEEMSTVYKTDSAIDVDYHFKSQTIFWTNPTADQVVSCSLTNTSQVRVLDFSMKSPEGLAVDWVHDNLYVVDSGLRAVVVLTLDGMSKKTLVTEDIDQPRSLVVDPRLGWMYWTDWGEEPKIEKCGMNGEVRKVIFNRDLGWPNGLTIDYKEQRLYYADARIDVLGSITTDGQDYREIVSRQRRLAHPFSLTMYRDRVFWSDWKSRCVQGADKRPREGQKVQDLVCPSRGQPYGVQVYHPDRQPWGENQCPEAKCSHFCLAVPKVAGTERGAVQCACPDIMALVNGSQCVGGKPAQLLVAMKQSGLLTVDLATGSKGRIPVSDGMGADLVDFNFRSNIVYAMAPFAGVLYSVNLTTGQTRKLITDLGDARPQGLAVDWIHHLLYWTQHDSSADNSTSSIHVATTSGAFRATLISGDLGNARAVVLDPNEGYMYFADWGKAPKIEKATMAGQARTVLVRENVEWVNGLVIDYTYRRLYWVDAKLDLVGSVGLDGLEPRVVLRGGGLKHPYGLTLFKDALVWGDWQTRSLHNVSKWAREGLDNATDSGLVSRVDTQPMEVVAFDVSRQPVALDHCRDNRCSHLCLPVPQVTILDTAFQCACPDGMRLVSDTQCQNGSRPTTPTAPTTSPVPEKEVTDAEGGPFIVNTTVLINRTIFEFENETTFEVNNETTTLPGVGTPSPATSEQLSKSLGRLEREVSAWSRIQGRQEVLLDQLNATLWREGQATRPWLEELNQTVHRQGGALRELEGALDTLDRTQRRLQNVIGLQEERLTEQENAIHSLEVSLQSQNQASLFYKRLMLFGKSRQYRIFSTPVRGLHVFSSRAGFNTLEEAKSSCVVVGGKLIEMTQAQLLEASSSLKRDGLVSAWHWIGWARQDGGHQWAFLSNQEPVGNVTWANPVPDSAKCARFLPHGLFSGEMCSSQYGDPALCTL